MELEGVARGAGAVREGEVVERSRKAHEVARPDRQRLEAAARPRPAVSAGAAGCAGGVGEGGRVPGVAQALL